MYHHFEVLSERTKEYRRFNVTGTLLTALLHPPNNDTDSVSPNPPNSDTDPGSLNSPDTDTDPWSLHPPSNTDTDTARLNHPSNTDTDPGSLTPPSNTSTNPVNHFLASVNELFQYALQNFSDSVMVGITILNEVNTQDKAIGFSFRRKDQISGDVIWSVFEKVSQSNS
jgi:hypothetical protein